MPMHPYKNFWKRRERLMPKHQSVFDQIYRYLHPFYQDLWYFWVFEPYSRTVKLTLTAVVAFLFMIPLVFFAVLPIWTLLCFQIILGPLCPYDIIDCDLARWLKDTEITEWEKLVLISGMRDMVGKMSLRLSIMAASYDCVQSLRNMGINQPGLDE